MTVEAVEEFLTTAELSAEVRVAESTLRYWRSTGIGGPRSFKLGRRVLYRRSDVEEWVKAQERETSRGGFAIAAKS